MELKSIELNNFRGFRGHHVLDLSCNDEKNIIAILGNNTFGKSTVVQSFVWCFYDIRNFDEPNKLYNRADERELPPKTKVTTSVEVVFVHDGITYTARREFDYFKNINGNMVQLKENSVFSMTYVDNETGQTKPCGQLPHELAKAINSILPKELSSYFFFEGERDNELKTKNLSLAVKNLLGLEALTKMREHIHGNTQKPSSNSVIGYFEEKQVDSANEKAIAEWNKIIAAEAKMASAQERLDEIENEIDLYKSKISTINEKLRQAEPTKLLQKTRDEIKTELILENKALEEAYKRYIADFNAHSVEFFALPLISSARAKLQQMDIGDKGIKGIEARAIKELLARGECLCKTQLKEGSVAYREVEKYLDLLPPKSLGTLVSGLQDEMTVNAATGKEFKSRFEQNYQAVQFCIQKINNLERKEKEALDKLKEIGDVQTTQYETDLREYTQRINSLQKERDSKISEKEYNKALADSARISYNALKGKTAKNAEYALCAEYAKRIFEWVSSSYDDKEKSVRKRLQENVTQIFNNIYTGNRKVVIDSSYNISIVPAADTGGLKVIQYFSYVGGLVKLAKEIMKEDYHGQKFGEEYPLVLDAAFSHADEEHTKAIAVELSKVTNQLIFAVMGKDWEYVSAEIEDKIARTYKLVKLSEDEVAFEEV